MAETFATFLLGALKSRKMTLRAYALAIGLGKSHSYAYRIAKGLIGPPLKDLDRWAAPLELAREERARFELLAEVANSPPGVRAWFADAERRLRSQETGGPKPARKSAGRGKAGG